MPARTTPGIRTSQMRYSRRETLIAGFTLAVGARSRSTRAAGQEPTVEIVMHFATPGRNYVFDEPGPLGDPVVVWTGPVGAGKLPSHPVVADGAIFFGNGEGVIAIDEATGERRWTFDEAASDNDEWWAGATATYIDGIVFSGSEFGVLYAIDAESGDKIWELHSVGVGVEPTWADRLLYVPSDRNLLYAVEAATGNVVWQTETEDALYSWPAFADGRVYVATWNGALHAYDGHTGAWLWTHAPEPPFFASNVPVIANGLVYTKRFPTEGDDTHETVFALNAASGELVFEIDWLPTGMGGPTVSATTLYMGTPEGILYAADAHTGELRWQYDAGGNLDFLLYLVGDTLYLNTAYFDTADFIMHAVDAHDGTPRWTLPIDEQIAFGLDVADRKLYFSTLAGTLWIVGGTESGAEPRESSPATPVTTEPTPQESDLEAGFDPATVDLLWIAPAEAGLGAHCAVAIDQQGFLQVTDGAVNDIKVFDPGGAFVESWGGTEQGAFRFSDGETTLGGIAFDEAGNAYVSDSLNHRIQKFGPDRAFLATIGAEGNGPGELRQPVAAVDRTGERLIVADGGNSRVQILDLDGAYLDQWGGPGDLNGQFHRPQAIAIVADGTVYVADRDARRIQHFSPNGTYLGDIGTRDELGDVTGVAADEAGNVFAASPSRGAVLIYGPDGTLLGAITEVSGAGPLDAPRQVLLDSRSDLYVLAGDRVLKLGLG